MTKEPSRGKSSKPLRDGTVIELSSLEDPDALTPLNFRVPAQFHREFKLYAVQHGMSMVELVQESFRVMKAHQKR